MSALPASRRHAGKCSPPTVPLSYWSERPSTSREVALLPLPLAGGREVGGAPGGYKSRPPRGAAQSGLAIGGGSFGASFGAGGGADRRPGGTMEAAPGGSYRRRLLLLSPASPAAVKALFPAELSPVSDLRLTMEQLGRGSAGSVRAGPVSPPSSPPTPGACSRPSARPGGSAPLRAGPGAPLLPFLFLSPPFFFSPHT